MTLEDYNALHEIVRERRLEAEELKVRIEEQSGYIREAKARLLAMENLEPEDKKVFSPRKADVLYKEEIRKIKEEKSLHEENSRLLQERKAVIDSQIAKLEEILEHEKKDFATQFCQKELKEIIGKIKSSSQFIDRNPIQARQDFAIIAKALQEIVKKMGEV